jgi:hypothetical protein
MHRVRRVLLDSGFSYAAARSHDAYLEQLENMYDDTLAQAAWRDAAPFSTPMAATLGALMASWATFAPSFLWIFAGAPHMEQLRANKRLAAALSAITAVVVGVMSYLAAWFGLHLLFGESGWETYGALRWRAGVAAGDTVLVTGANGGIGFETARALAAAGARVLLIEIAHVVAPQVLHHL